ncbi:hypothetical protein ABZ769_34365 [Streptomyces olivoreticuli]
MTSTATETPVAQLLHHLAGEANGPLATVRRLVEHTAHRLADRPDPHDRDAGQRLEWAARRLYGLQQDLDAAANTLHGASLPSPATAHVPAGPPALSAHRLR